MDRDPDRMTALRRDFEAQKRRVHDAGDAGGIEQLEELERKAADPSFWESAPSVLDQLSDHLRRLGIT